MSRGPGVHEEVKRCPKALVSGVFHDAQSKVHYSLSANTILYTDVGKRVPLYNSRSLCEAGYMHSNTYSLCLLCLQGESYHPCSQWSRGTGTSEVIDALPMQGSCGLRGGGQTERETVRDRMVLV